MSKPQKFCTIWCGMTQLYKTYATSQVKQPLYVTNYTKCRHMWRPHVVDLSFIVIFYAKTSMQYALIIWLFLGFIKNFLWYFFSKAGFKRSLNTRKPFTNNITKWKIKQSWKGNVWKYLFMLPTFFIWGRK